MLTIPTSKDCFLHGRNDKEFLYWRWKPHKCELPRFELSTFFQIMREKRLAFIGDSVARNQMESLLCILSQEEAPIDVYKDAKDRSRTWFFPRNNFTLMVLWTRFLVKGVEREGGVYDFHLDQVDEKWGYNVSQGLVDYAIVSSAQWYFRKNYLFEGHCERSKPYDEENLLISSKNNDEWEVRDIQIEEIERAKKEGYWKGQQNIQALDITKVMLLRPDGHPGSHWRDKKKKGFNDCVHWCMPGPIDVWNDLLLALLN
uniref:Trichome birefringence-like N-terminal domain-containing protein n=1 Tax=Chenopodium quinoa TaxID=63459 RepID=A0A803KQS2_CHEQI